MNEQLRNAYLHCRLKRVGHLQKHSMPLTATLALENARLAITEQPDKKYYRPASVRGPLAGDAYQAHGETLRFIDDYRKIGLRLVGTAHDVCKNLGSRIVEHTGWYADLFQDETIHGLIFRLPGKDKQARYVYGISEPCNEFACTLCVSVIAEGDVLESSYDTDDGILHDLFRWSDNLAEKSASRSREHCAAWHSGQDWREYMLKAQQLEADIKELKSLPSAATLERVIVSTSFDLRRTQQDINSLLHGGEGVTYWDANDSELVASFCDGAELSTEQYKKEKAICVKAQKYAKK